MKKNIVILLISIFTLFILAGCQHEEIPEHRSVSAKVKGYDNLQEMEEDADLIVRVVRTEKETPVLKRNKDDNVYTGFTFSEINVKEIYMDSTNSVETGDCLTLLENEVYDKKDNIIYHIAGYNMLEEEREYLLFLNQCTYTDGSIYYVAVGVNFGTISLEDDGRVETKYTRTGDVINNYSIFESIWNDAKEKYVQ